MVTPEEKQAIEALLRRMRADDGSQQLDLKFFLRKSSHHIIYKEHVRAYYYKYIDGKDISHKQLILHNAAIYFAIAYNTGIDTTQFHGPDFDKFMYTYCGIVYNNSDTPRGRYRQVADVYLKYSKMIRHGAVLPDKQSELKARRDFLTYKNNMLDIISGRNRLDRKAACVPVGINEEEPLFSKSLPKK